VHDSVAHFDGSISAEHGVGQLRRGEILRYKSPIEMELMHKVKAALDPLGIMNPGKLIARINEPIVTRTASPNETRPKRGRRRVGEETGRRKCEAP